MRWVHFILLANGERWVGRYFGHQGFGEETGLEFKATAISGFVVEGGVVNGFVETGF